MQELPPLKFKNEGELQQAIAGLLSRMPDVTGVQILHSAQEFGKDIVFQSKGPLGEALQCACVVKNHKLSGAAGNSRNARAALEQIEQALDTPFADASGESVRVHRVYLFTPSTIAPPAMNSILGKLEHRAGQVFFISGTELFRLFSQYWPDFFAPQPTPLEEHLDRVKRRARDSSHLSDVMHRYELGNLPRYEPVVYVAPFFHRDLFRHSFQNPLDQLSYPASTSRIAEANTPRPSVRGRDLEGGEHAPEKVLWGEGGWAIADLKEFKRRLLLLRTTIAHFKAWDYWETVYDYDSSEVRELSTDDLIDSFVESVDRSWLMSAREALGVSHVERAKIPEKMKVLFHEPQRLRRALEELREHIAEGLTRVKQSCNKLDKEIDRKQRRDLSGDEFIELATADDCFRSAPTGSFESKQGIIIRFEKAGIIDTGLSLLVVGGPGFGKTSFCKRNALLDAESFDEGKGNFLPVYIPAHALIRHEIATVDQTFLGGESKNITKMLKEQTRIRLYLDGLDEIPDVSRRDRLIDLAREASEKRGWQVILTARNYLYTNKLRWLPRISISELGEDEISSLVNGWLPQETIPIFFEQIQGVPGFRRLMGVPLLATIIILVFRQTRRIPENRSRIYSMFVELLLGGWDLAKSVLRPSEFGRTVKATVLAKVAANMHNDRRVEFTTSDLRKASKATFNISDVQVVEALAAELLADGMIERAGINYQFAHHSFQEFLVAKGMLGSPDPSRIRSTLRAFLRGDDWWREVIRLYIGLYDNPKELTQWLLTEFDRMGIECARERTDDVLSGIADAFPGFDIKKVVGYQPKALRSEVI